MAVTLLCSVRACRLPLAREGRRLTCPRAHSFDVARRGYVNLLQPQDRRSARPGDSAAAVAARRRFLAGGFETELTRAIGDLLTLAPGDALLEVGCGEGHYLAAFTARFGCEGHGVDLSVPAIEAAAARHAGLHLVVANADRVAALCRRARSRRWRPSPRAGTRPSSAACSGTTAGCCW